MRIVLDLQGAQTASTRNRGIGRYSLALAEAAIRNGGGHEFHIVLNSAYPESVEAIRGRFGALLGTEQIHVFDVLGPLQSSGWNEDPRRTVSEVCRETFLARLNPDVVHVSTLIEGMREDAVSSIGRTGVRIPTAVTLYDLIPLHDRSAYLREPGMEEWYLGRLEQLERADLLLAISQCSAEDAIGRLKIDPVRVVNIGAAADESFTRVSLSQREREELLASFGIAREFVMYTGGFDKRKNVDRLFAAFAGLPRSLRDRHQLVISCECPDSEQKRLRELGRSHGLPPDALVITGFVSDSNLAALYSLAKLFVFPSLDEGFGLPLLEAMRCGAPALASNRSSMPEIVRLEEAMFDPEESDSIRTSLLEALSDDKRLVALRENSREQARRFSWDKVARRAIAAFEELREREQSGEVPRPQARKLRLAYVSPLPPARTGIAAYSKQLLPHLARFYDIDAVVADDASVSASSEVAANCGVRVIGAEELLRRSADYDRVLYNFGNSEFHDYMIGLAETVAGTVILHDFDLSGLIRHHAFAAGGTDAEGELSWLAALHRSHGVAAALAWLDAEGEGVNRRASAYPCCGPIIGSSVGTVVHSEFARALARRWFVRERAERMTTVPLPCEVPDEIDREGARQRLGLSVDTRLLCSFGVIAPDKCVSDVLDGWMNSTAFAEGSRLVFVGGGSPEFLDQVQQEIAGRGLGDRVEITGWIDASRYRDFLAACDVAVQLRRASHGESSLTLLQCLSFGIATVANAAGSTSELSKRALRLLPEQFTREELRDAVDALCAGGPAVKRMRKAARALVRDGHDPAECGQRLIARIEDAYATHADVAAAVRPFVPQLPAPDVARLAQIIAESTRVRAAATVALDVSQWTLTTEGDGEARRAQLRAVAAALPPEWRLELIRFDDDTGGYVVAHRLLASLLNLLEPLASDDPVELSAGDFIVLTDGAPVSEPRLAALSHLRRGGVRLAVSVADVRDDRVAAMDPDDTIALFDGWLRLVAGAERIVCPSRSLADELLACIDALGLRRPAIEVSPAVEASDEGPQRARLVELLAG